MQKFPWDDVTNTQLAPARHVYTMLNFAEEQMLYYLAAQSRNRGAVLDLGCYLGGSTARLALGLNAARCAPELQL